MSICPTSAEGARTARGSEGMRPQEILKSSETTPDDYFNIINVTFTKNLI